MYLIARDLVTWVRLELWNDHHTLLSQECSMTPTFQYLAIDYYVDLYYMIVYEHALLYCW